MRDKLIFFNWITVIFISSFIFSCSKMGDIQKEFIDLGLRDYIAKIDTVITHSGNERLEILLTFPLDPKITGVTIFWDNRADSISKVLPEKFDNKSDTLKVMINNLRQGAIHFEAINFSNNEDISIPVSFDGVVYGANFQQSLLARAVDRISRDGNNLRLTWLSPEGINTKSVIEYKNGNNETVEMSVSPSDNETILDDFPFGGEYKITSYYLPDSTAIDMFSVEEVKKISIKEIELDKEQFKVERLSSDVSNASTFVNVFNNDYGDNATTPNVALPHSLTIDLGDTIVLTRLRIWQWGPYDVRSYLYSNIKAFDIYAGNELSDDWTDWTLLKECEILKPSGLPYGQRTLEDEVYAEKGHEYVFKEDLPGFRYIRFKLLESWQGIQTIYFSEFSLYGYGESF